MAHGPVDSLRDDGPSNGKARIQPIIFNRPEARFLAFLASEKDLDMKISYNTTPENAETQWMRLCAKHGQPEAANAGNASSDSMSNTQLHEHRKVVRRALNAITETLKPTDYDDQTTDALMFAGQIVSKINDQFQRQADATAFFGKKKVDAVMRNQADFDAHYKSRSSNEEGDYGISDFLRGVANMRTSPEVRNALSTGTGAAGGFTVPGVLMPKILGAMAPASSLLQAGAGIVMLDEGATSFTTAAIDTIPTAAWRAEGGTLATSDPAFRAVVATPRSLSFQFKVSRELLADGQNLQEALYLAIGQAFAKELDRTGLRGSGIAPEPKGIKYAGNNFPISSGVNGKSLDNYGIVFATLQELAEENAPTPTAMIMAPRTRVNLGGLVDTTGQPLRVPDMIQPIKQIVCSQIPITQTVGTSTDCSDIYVGDFGSVYFAMREQVSVQLLTELYAGTGEVGFACHLRADVVVTYPNAIAVITGVRPPGLA